MSKFKFTDQERAELKKEIESRIFTGPDDSQHIGTAGLFEIIEQIVNERERQECAALTAKLLEAEERIAEIKKVYYLINNGNLNQEGLTLYYAVGDIVKK